MPQYAAYTMFADESNTPVIVLGQYSVLTHLSIPLAGQMPQYAAYTMFADESDADDDYATIDPPDNHGNDMIDAYLGEVKLGVRKITFWGSWGCVKRNVLNFT